VLHLYLDMSGHVSHLTILIKQLTVICVIHGSNGDSDWNIDGIV